MKKIYINKLLALALAACLVLGGLTACAKKDDTVINIATIKGPTGMGMVYLMDETTNPGYKISVASAPDEALAQFISGEADLAAVPINAAGALYNKLNGNVLMLAVNTYGVMYLVANNPEIDSFEKLSGKTVYLSGQGSTPEYIMNYLIEKNGLADKVQLEYMSEHAEVVTGLVSSKIALGVLPEPNVTAALAKNTALSVSLDLTEEWDKVSETKLVQGCLIVKKDFYEAHKTVVDQFLTDYASSVDKVNASPAEAAELLVNYGIVASAALGAKAIPNSNIVCVTGEEMQQSAEAMLTVLYNANPKSIGGSLPPSEFYVK